MTETARAVLATFEALSQADQHAVALEILRRTSSSSDVSDEALLQVADELFCEYDAEEAAPAQP